MRRIPFYLLITLTSLLACHDTITTIKGCCEQPAVYVTFGTGKIYVPNVFTPNGDGINDKLVISGDSVLQIRHLIIRNSDGIIVYHNRNIPVNNWVSTWDGTSVNNIERGLYSYEMEVEAVDRTLKVIKGSVCNCPCDQEADKDIAPIPGCQFGIYDPHFTVFEQVEPLSCFQQ